MLRNAYFDSFKNKIHLWETINGERKYSVIDYTPYVYIENRDEKSEIKSIFGKGVVKRKFKTAREYKEFCESTISEDNVFENFVSPELQFLAERYHSIPDDEMEMVPLRIQYTDIEVVSEKIDTNRYVNIRVKGSDSGSLYKYKDFTESPISKNPEHLECFNEKTKKWDDFSEDFFIIKGGFPEPELAEWPIVLISCYDTFDKKVYSFGLKEYTGSYLNEDWFEYIKCDDELDLIDKYTIFVKNNIPDIITGWNVIQFDLAYIVNRVKNLYEELSNSYEDKDKKKSILEFGEVVLNRLSPIKRINTWKKLINGKEQTMIDIPGVTIIDYRDLYKQYSKTLLRINLESYRLDFVAKFELGEGKIEYREEYGSLNDLYKLNYNLYVEYNAIDNIRVKEIQDKRKFIDIVQLLSLVAKFPMKYYESVTRVIEGIFLTYYRRNNLAAEHFYGGVKEPFEAAYVKEPQIGLHGWGTDIDIKSSYPHGIMTLNMGNDSYIGTICKIFDSESLLDATEPQITALTAKKEYPDFIYRNRKKEEISVSSSTSKEEETKEKRSLAEFNKKLKERKICIAPNGSMFRTDKQSCLATIQKTLFNRRVEYKNTMKKWGIRADELRREYAKTKNEDLKSEIEKAQNEYDRFKSLQIVIKLIINSMYGALSVPYFRGYNLCIAEAICATGRLAIKSGMGFVNLVMNDPKKSKDLLNTLNEMKKLKEGR